MFFDLPTTLEVGGKTWNIRTDYRDVLTIITAFDDVELPPNEKAYVCLLALYEDFDNMPDTLYQEAFEKALKFIEREDEDSDKDDKKARKKVVDWEQDASLLFPAINRVAGVEVRTVEYMHWWTFMGYFMEIGEGVYSTVLSLRSKKNSGKKLEKWEQEWWNKNRDICKIRKLYTEEEKAQQDAYKALLGPR